MGNRVLWVVCALAISASGCGSGATAPSTTPVAASPNVTLEIWSVEVLRWASSGAYDYTVTYRFHNAGSGAITASIADAALSGPAGEGLGGAITRKPDGETVPAGTYSRYQTFTVGDGDISHPYADRLRASATYQPAGGAAATVSGESAVLHGPQTARVHEFSISREQARVGDTVVVRWNVESAKTILLESSIPTPPTGTRFSEYVEPVGSRTWVLQRGGVAWVDLKVDDPLIALTRTVVGQ